MHLWYLSVTTSQLKVQCLIGEPRDPQHKGQYGHSLRKGQVGEQDKIVRRSGKSYTRHKERESVGKETIHEPEKNCSHDFGDSGELREKQGPRSFGTASQGHSCTRGLRVYPTGQEMAPPLGQPEP